MLTEHIVIQNKFGLHTRAAAKLVALSSRFESKIELHFQGQIANCKSIMSLIVLGAAKNDTASLMIAGADEQDACTAIIHLINSKFGEVD